MNRCMQLVSLSLTAAHPPHKGLTITLSCTSLKVRFTLYNEDGRMDTVRHSEGVVSSLLLVLY